MKQESEQIVTDLQTQQAAGIKVDSFGIETKVFASFDAVVQFPALL